MLVSGLRKLCSVLLGMVLGEMEPPSFVQQEIPSPHVQKGSGGGELDLSISISYVTKCIVILV